jgi:hypothetical protein
MTLTTEDHKELEGQAWFCDSTFFRVFPRKLLMGEEPVSSPYGKYQQHRHGCTGRLFHSVLAGGREYFLSCLKNPDVFL